MTMKLFGNKKQNTKNKVKVINAPPPEVAKFEKGLVSIQDIISPSSIEVDFKHIRIGDSYYKTFFVVGYPRFVSPGWLEPLINFNHSIDISMFCYPESSSGVLDDLRRKIAEMEATLSSQIDNGQDVD